MWLILLFSMTVYVWSLPQTDDLHQIVVKHRCSSSFQAYIPSNFGVHPYYQFLQWWTQENIKQPSLDPNGEITHALLTDAVGFGGWSRTVLASQKEMNIYVNTAFFSYWGNNSKAPDQTNSVLTYVWKAAREKEILLKPHEWLYPFGSQGQFQTVAQWYNYVSQTSVPLDEACADIQINALFKCKSSLSFQQEISKNLAKNPSAGVLYWISFSAASARLPEPLQLGNPLEAMLRKSLHWENRVGFLVEDVMCNYLPQCLDFWHILASTDLSQVDIEVNTNHIRLMQRFLMSAYEGKNRQGVAMRYQAVRQNFMDMFYDGVQKKTFLLNDKDFPVELVAYGCLCDNSVSVDEAVYAKAWIKIHNSLSKYGSLKHPNAITRLVQDFLSYVLTLNNIHEYVVAQSGYIFDELVLPGTVLDEVQNEWAEMHRNAYLLVHRLREGFEVPGSVFYSLKDNVITWWAGRDMSVQSQIPLDPQEFNLLVQARDRSNQFANKAPIFDKVARHAGKHHPRYNMASENRVENIHNMSRAIDFLIQVNTLKVEDKLVAMLGLYRDAMI